MPTNTVLTIFRSETAQAEAAVKRLRGVERERAKEALADLNAHNSKLQDSIAVWGKVAVGVGAGIAIFMAAQVSAKAYLEDLRLESAAAGANIDKLRESVHGLVETDDLLAFAGKAQHAIWKLNQQEMQLVLEGANALRIQMGTELTPTVQALGEAITKGAGRGLKEFGIEADSKAELVTELQKRIAALRGETSLAGDDFERSGVKWADAVDDLKSAFGRLALQLAPVVSGIADVTKGFADSINTLQDWDTELRALRDDWFASMDSFFGFDTDRTRARSPGSQTRLGQTLGQAAGVPSSWQVTADEWLQRGQAGWRWLLQQPDQLSIEERLKLIRANQPGGWGDPWHAGSTDLKVPGGLTPSVDGQPFAGDSVAIVQGMSEIVGSLRTVVAALPEAIRGTLPTAQGWHPLSEAAGQTGTGIEGISHGAEAAAEVARAAAEAMQVTKGRTVLEALFGTPGEIELTAAAVSQLGKVFDVFAGSAGAAMDAWITGQKSMGEAIRDTIAEGLRGIAVEAQVHALKEAAFGIAGLAFGDPKAALHLKAAAMFEATAIAAGFGARAMGAGRGASAGGGNALAGGVGAGAAGGGGEPRNVTINLDAAFLALTELERRQLIYQTTRTAQGGRLSTTSVRPG